MKLTHKIPFKIDDKELNIEVRELKKSEVKILKKKEKEISEKANEPIELLRETQKLQRKIERLKQKMLISNNEEKLKILDDQELLYDRIEEIQSKTKDIQLSVEDAENKSELLYKQRMEFCVSGDIEELFEICEDFGYKKLWSAISEAVEKIEKK